MRMSMRLLGGALILSIVSLYFAGLMSLGWGFMPEGERGWLYHWFTFSPHLVFTMTGLDSVAMLLMCYVIQYFLILRIALEAHRAIKAKRKSA